MLPGEEDFVPIQKGKQKATLRSVTPFMAGSSYGFVTCSEMLDSRSIVYFCSQD
jgi:hypothetical protein